MHWKRLRPASAASQIPYLTVLEDDSVLAGGDQSKRDVYELKFAAVPAGVTAVRLEVLPDERLPNAGQGEFRTKGRSAISF